MNTRVKALRRKMGLSQKEFGERLGVTGSAICTIEAGRRGVTEQMAISICHEFGVNYEWLKNGTVEIFTVGMPAYMENLSKEFGLDELDRRILVGYLSLPPRDRAVIKRYVRTVVVDSEKNQEGKE